MKRSKWLFLIGLLLSNSSLNAQDQLDVEAKKREKPDALYFVRDVNTNKLTFYKIDKLSPSFKAKLVKTTLDEQNRLVEEMGEKLAIEKNKVLTVVVDDTNPESGTKAWFHHHRHHHHHGFYNPGYYSGYQSYAVGVAVPIYYSAPVIYASECFYAPSYVTYGGVIYGGYSTHGGVYYNAGMNSGFYW